MEKNSVKIAKSTKQSCGEAVTEISDQFAGVQPRLVLYFASSAFDAACLSQSFQRAFPTAITIGCSTSGEIISGSMLKGSVVAMALDSRTIDDVAVAIVPEVSKENHVREAFAQFAEYYRAPMRDLDYSKYVGLILVDGLTLSEEKLMETIGDLTDVLFVGGSAGDDLKFAATYVCANGVAYRDAAVLALLKPAVKFEVVKTQSFAVLDKTLAATKVNEAEREVLEFNNLPAIVAYAQAIGQPVEKAPDFFMRYPVGLVINGEPYVRSPQRVRGTSMLFYCNVLEGMTLNLLESLDIVSDMQKTLQKSQENGPISGVINFHCILRTLELEQKGQTDAYGKVFSDIPTVGFSTYGEEYLGHINQTSTMLVLH